MKKVYISFASLALCATAMGQNLTKEYDFGAKRAITSPKTVRPAVSVKPSVSAGEESEKVLNILWSEDFEGSTTALTTSKGTYTAGGSDAYWALGSTHPMSTYGYTDNLTGKFLIWNSFGPVYPTEPANAFASTPVDGTVTTPDINLTTAGTGGVSLKFKTEAMYCCNATEIPFYIAISENGGTTFGAPIQIDLGVDRNIATEDIAQPMDVTVDITPYTTGLTANTRIKFIWDGVATDQNGQANTHYFWLIDDVTVFSRPDYNVEVLDMWLGDIATDFEYTSIPQVFAGEPMTVQAKIKNIGRLVPSATMKVEISGPSPATTVLATQTGGVVSGALAVGELDTITFATTIDMSAYAVGTYTVTATLELGTGQIDEDLTDNVYVRTFKITANDYGQRDFEMPLYFGSIGKDDGATNTESSYMGVGSVFYIPSNVELHGVNLKIGKTNTYPTTVYNASTGVGEVYVQLYRIDWNASDFQTAHLLEVGDWYFPVTSTMIPATNNSSKDVTLNFHQATGIQTIPNLLAGEYYLALINHDGGSGNHFCYLENPVDDDYSTHLFGDYGTTSGLRWFTMGSQVVTELNFNQTLDVNELESEIKIGFIAPNPTSGETTVAYSLPSNSDVTVQIVDLTGKVIKTITENNLEAGTHMTNFDATNMSSGVYYVNISSNNSVVTQKFIKK